MTTLKLGTKMKTTNFAIWYMRPKWFGRGIMGEIPDRTNIAGTHVYVKTLTLPGGQAQLDHVFEQMQGENWSPNGEARELIESLGLEHTSMSVGDIVVVDGQTFVVASFGFTEIT